MKHRAKSSRWPRRHPIWFTAIIAIVLVMLASTGYVISIVRSPLPPASVTTLVATSVVAPSKSIAIPWPSQGEAGFLVPSLGVRQDSPTQTAVAIGSVTKLMTAYIILKDYPLAPGQSGPTVTVTQADVDNFGLQTLDSQSVATIAAGETLTVYQLLEGLLVHSANDYAFILAEFDAGSLSGFIAKMNAQAAALTMTATHYADPAGASPDSISTPHDQLGLAGDLMTNPVFASIVAMRSVTLPVAGTITTYQPLLGTNGVVGVKSGLTVKAGGCDVMAVNVTIAGQTVQILTAVTGQKTGNWLATAGNQALNLANSVAATIDGVTVATTGERVGRLGWPKASVPLVSTGKVAVPAWPGQHVTISLRQTRTVTKPLAGGTVIGVLSANNGRYRSRASVLTSGDLHEPTLLQRVV